MKIKTLKIIATDSSNYPEKLKVYKNVENVDFDLINDEEPIQEFDLLPNLGGSQELALKFFSKIHSRPIKFSNVTN